MLHSFTDITKCVIGATDGQIGRVCDAYFDDESWVIRYLIVDMGARRFHRSVLIPPLAVRQPRWSDGILPVSMSKLQVMHSPDIDTQNSRSKQHALRWLDDYTSLGYAESDSAYHWEYPYLRSAVAVSKYQLHATDGEIGRVQGLLIDENSWAIRFMIVNTSSWWLGHQVLIAPESIDAVQWSDADVIVDLTRQAVKDAPIHSAM